MLVGGRAAIGLGERLDALAATFELGERRWPRRPGPTKSSAFSALEQDPLDARRLGRTPARRAPRERRADRGPAASPSAAASSARHGRVPSAAASRHAHRPVAIGVEPGKRRSGTSRDRPAPAPASRPPGSPAPDSETRSSSRSTCPVRRTQRAERRHRLEPQRRIRLSRRRRSSSAPGTAAASPSAPATARPG